MTASAAQPVLASTLYEGLKAREAEPKAKRRRVGTGCEAIDDALRGGFDYGRICCISGEKGVGKTANSNNLLSTHLLSQPSSSAAIIDTTGTFSVLRLHSTLVSRLRSQRTRRRTWRAANAPTTDQSTVPDAASVTRTAEETKPAGTASEAEVEDEDEETAAAKLLDRVNIMRVFDFVGVIEAVGEIRDELETSVRPHKDSSPMPSSPPLPREAGMKRTMSKVGDSEDEDEEEMLFDRTEEASGVSSEPVEATKDAASEDILTEDSAPTGKTGMIIIDNITHVLSPLMKADYVHAHTLLTTFLRSLAHLTRSHDLCTVLINGAITPRPPPAPAPAPTDRPDQAPEHPDPRPSAEAEQHPSIFASNTSRPALGRTFPFLIDLHVFVSSLPKSRRDAAVVYGGGGAREGRERRAETVGVVEVLADRFGGRVGRWGALSVQDGGVEVSSAL